MEILQHFNLLYFFIKRKSVRDLRNGVRITKNSVFYHKYEGTATFLVIQWLRLPLPRQGFPCVFAGKESAWNAGDPDLIPGSGISPGEGKGTLSSILAWRIPWTVQPMGSQRVGHDSNFHFTSNAGVWVWSLVREIRSHMPQGQKTKTENRKNIVINSIKTLKMVHIKEKKNLKKEPPQRSWSQSCIILLGSSEILTSMGTNMIWWGYTETNT